MGKASLVRSRSWTPLVALGVVTVLAATALWLFQPWRLWTSSTVNEAAPALTPPATASRSNGPSGTGPTGSGPAGTPVPGQDRGSGGRLSTGTFLSHEHPTTGRVRLLALPDGTRVLRLEGLDTSDGPALRVWLSDQPVTPDGWRVFDDGEHLDLGALKANRGSHNYPVPPGADLTRLTSVSIWCARFRVSFGAAALHPDDG